MIRALLRHHAQRIEQRAAAGLPFNALRNCHVEGLSSIMLYDEPANRVRLFYAERDHALWRNDIPHGLDMSVAVHPHHCDITLALVFGRVRNDTFWAVPSHAAGHHKCEYVSGVQWPGESALIDTGERALLSLVGSTWLYPQGESLHATTLHTIYVPRGETAAWIVIEGRENPDYAPVCYTRNLRFDPSNLYQPMPADHAAKLLRDAATFRERE